MNRGMIASGYARAIFSYAGKKGQADSLEDYFTTLSVIWRKTPMLEEAIVCPVLAPSVKKELLQVASGAGNDETFNRVLDLVFRNKRESFLLWIALHYEKICKESKQKVDVYLTTAVALDQDTLEQLSGTIANFLHRTAIVHTIVDPDLIGGYQLEWDTYRYDGGIRKSLQQIKKQLTSNYDRTVKNK